MYSNSHRVLAENYPTFRAYVAAVRRTALSIAQDGAGTGYGILGVWLDADRRGVFLRIVRDVEMNLAQGCGWRPHKAFALDKVADGGLEWLSTEIREI